MMKLILTFFLVAISSSYGCDPCDSIPTGYKGLLVANLSIALAANTTAGNLYVNFSDSYVSSTLTPYNILFSNYSAALVDLQNLVPGSIDNVDQLLYEINILINTVVTGLELEIGLASSQAPDAVCKIRQNLINVLNLQLNARISLVNSLEIAYANATAAGNTAYAAQLCDRLSSASVELEDQLNNSINVTLLFVNCTTTNRTISLYYNYLNYLYTNLENLLAARIRTLYNELGVNCTVGCQTTELIELSNRLLDVIERQISDFQSAPQEIRASVSRRLVSLLIILNSVRNEIVNIICCLLNTLSTAISDGDRTPILDVIQQLIDLLNRIDALTVTATNLRV